MKYDMLLTIFDVAISCDPIVETIGRRDRFLCVQRAQGIFHVVGMTSWKTESTLPFSGGSMTLGSCNVTM